MNAYTIKHRRSGHVVRVEGDGLGAYIVVPEGIERDAIRIAIQVHEALVVAMLRDERSVPVAETVMDAGTRVFVQSESVAAWRIAA